MDPFDNLPDELLIVQAANLPLSTIDDICRTNPRFNRVICDNELFWRQKFIRDYEVVPQNYRGNWKQLYREYSAIWGLSGAPREVGTVVSSVVPGGMGPSFNTPILVNQEFVEFFSQARLGPVIEGQFKINDNLLGHGKRKPDNTTLRPTNRPLNMVLFFTQPFILGERNPLYGIIKMNTLTPLFALHAYYTRIQHPNDKTMLSASEEMRRLLPGTIERTIRRDMDRMNDDENLSDVFDPNNFLYAHFSKLITIGRTRFLTPEEIDSLTPEVTRVYGPLFPELQVITPELILEYQHDQVSLARAYKNQLQTREIREIREIRESRTRR